MQELPYSAAAERNKQPILEALSKVLGGRGHALEIASGTGQHAVWFAGALPAWTWQPTDADARMLPVIAQRAAHAGLPNLLSPRRLDVMSAQWPSEGACFDRGFDAIYCANLLHIAPPAVCGALMAGAARHLRQGGSLITYGPYFEDNAAPASSNLAFDASLRARDGGWGIRRLADVVEEARAAGLQLSRREDMPANNLLLVFVNAQRPSQNPVPV